VEEKVEGTKFFPQFKCHPPHADKGQKHNFEIKSDGQEILSHGLEHLDFQQNPGLFSLAFRVFSLKGIIL